MFGSWVPIAAQVSHVVDKFEDNYMQWGETTYVPPGVSPTVTMTFAELVCLPRMVAISSYVVGIHMCERMDMASVRRTSATEMLGIKMLTEGPLGLASVSDGSGPLIY